MDTDCLEIRVNGLAHTARLLVRRRQRRFDAGGVSSRLRDADACESRERCDECAKFHMRNPPRRSFGFYSTKTLTAVNYPAG